jgi:hypothetical protein
MFQLYRYLQFEFFLMEALLLETFALYRLTSYISFGYLESKTVPDQFRLIAHVRNNTNLIQKIALVGELIVVCSSTELCQGSAPPKGSDTKFRGFDN